MESGDMHRWLNADKHELEAEVLRLREALRPFAEETAFTIVTNSTCTVDGKALENARAALEGE